MQQPVTRIDQLPTAEKFALMVSLGFSFSNDELLDYMIFQQNEAISVEPDPEHKAFFTALRDELVATKAKFYPWLVDKEQLVDVVTWDANWQPVMNKAKRIFLTPPADLTQ